MRTGNMVAAVVGRVDGERVAERLHRRLCALEGRVLEARDGQLAGPTPRLEQLERQTQTAWIVAGWSAPPVGHADSPAMTLLTTILGGSLDSRLFTELRDKRGLAYEIGAQYRAYVGPSCMICYMGTNGDQYTVGRKGLVGEVERLRAGGPTAEELERARAYLSGSHRMAMERNAHRASSYGIHELFGLGYDYAGHFLERLAAVEHDDLMRVADTWWRACTIAAVVPEGKVDVSVS
jgi:zinc protease